jgi:hypothetical protein
LSRAKPQHIQWMDSPENGHSGSTPGTLRGTGHGVHEYGSWGKGVAPRLDGANDDEGGYGDFCALLRNSAAHAFWGAHAAGVCRVSGCDFRGVGGPPAGHMTGACSQRIRRPVRAGRRIRFMGMSPHTRPVESYRRGQGERRPTHALSLHRGRDMPRPPSPEDSPHPQPVFRRR